jgi:hypothetical protein
MESGHHRKQEAVTRRTEVMARTTTSIGLSEGATAGAGVDTSRSIVDAPPSRSS